MLDVRFFSEMEMRREGVLKKMNDEISDQHEKIREAPRQCHRLRKNLENRRGQHESRAQRQKIFQVLARPFAVQDKKPAQDVGRRGGQPEQQSQHHARGGTGMGNCAMVIFGPGIRAESASQMFLVAFPAHLLPVAGGSSLALGIASYLKQSCVTCNPLNPPSANACALGCVPHKSNPYPATMAE